jgi:hypothetical protein
VSCLRNLSLFQVYEDTFFYDNFFFFYSYVHTMFGSSLLPLPPTSLTTRQKLFCPCLWFCWYEDILECWLTQFLCCIQSRFVLYNRLMGNHYVEWKVECLPTIIMVKFYFLEYLICM